MDNLHLTQNIPVTIGDGLLVMTDAVGPDGGQDRPGATLRIATDDEERVLVVMEGDTITLLGHQWRVEQVDVVLFTGDLQNVGATLNPQSSLTLRALDTSAGPGGV